MKSKRELTRQIKNLQALGGKKTPLIAEILLGLVEAIETLEEETRREGKFFVRKYPE